VSGQAGPDPRRAADLAGLAHELDLLRRRAARGTGKAKVSLDDLTSRVGVPRSTVHTYVTGRRLPPAEVLDQIVIALGEAAPEQREWAEAWFRVSSAIDRQRAAAARAVPAQLPGALTGFVGREEYLRRLDAVLGERGDTVPILCIDGTAGVGKTALALRWSHNVRHEFPDGQLWTNLHGHGPLPPRDPTQVLDRFLRSLGLAGEQIPEDADARAELLRSRLSGRRVLVVLDNADNEEQVRPLLPGSRGCLVVVTSRNRLPGLSIREGAVRVSVTPLAPEESTALLAGIVGADLAGDPDAAEIVRCCAGLPLALRIAAHRMAPDGSLAQVANDLRDRRARIDALSWGGDTATSVRAVLSWSYHALSEPAAATFRLLGLHPGSTISVPAAAALAGTSARDAGRVLDALARGHLVEQRANGRYGLHDLLHAFAVELAETRDAPQVRHAALSRLLDHYLRHAAAAVSVSAPYDDRDRAERWLDAERSNLLAAAEVAANEGHTGFVTGLSSLLWRDLGMHAYLDEAIALHTLALAAARAEGDTRAVCYALGHLGGVHGRLGRYAEAIEEFEQCLATAREIGDRAAECRSTGTLGIVYARLGQYHRAADSVRLALQVARESGDQVAEGRAATNLADVLDQLGRLDEALRHHRLSLARARRQAIRAARRLRCRASAWCSPGWATTTTRSPTWTRR
jgi:tetratricopeptide (TPR) repeat protein